MSACYLLVMLMPLKSLQGWQLIQFLSLCSNIVCRGRQAESCLAIRELRHLGSLQVALSKKCVPTKFLLSALTCKATTFLCFFFLCLFFFFIFATYAFLRISNLPMLWLLGTRSASTSGELKSLWFSFWGSPSPNGHSAEFGHRDYFWFLIKMSIFTSFTEFLI